MDYSPKRVGETEIFTVDYAGLLGVGETIVTAVWSNSVLIGSDASPNAMVVGSATISGSKVSTLLTAGVFNNTYAPICTATTSLGQVLILPDIGMGKLHVVG